MMYQLNNIVEINYEVIDGVQLYKINNHSKYKKFDGCLFEKPWMKSLLITKDVKDIEINGKMWWPHTVANSKCIPDTENITVILYKQDGSKVIFKFSAYM